MTVNPKCQRDQLRVLVVEDDRSVRRMLRFCLRDAGFEITETSTGGEALLSLQAEAPEAVILDLGLPDGLGGAVLERLSKLEKETRTAPAWMVISALDREDVARLFGPLDKHFLAKPFDPWELVTRLQELLAANNKPQTAEEE